MFVSGGAGSCRTVTGGRESCNGHVWRLPGRAGVLLELGGGGAWSGRLGTCCALAVNAVMADRKLGMAILAAPRLLSGRGWHRQWRWCRGRPPDKVSGLGVAGGARA